MCYSPRGYKQTRQQWNNIVSLCHWVQTFQKYTCCCSVTQSCQLFATSWTATHQASLSFTISWSLLKLMSIESVMPSNNLILCHPLLLLPSIFPIIKVFSNDSTLHIRWPCLESSLVLFEMNMRQELNVLQALYLDFVPCEQIPQDKEEEELSPAQI